MRVAPLEAPVRLLDRATSRLASIAIGRPIEVRVRAGSAAARRARIGPLAVRMRDLTVGGLRVDQVAAEARDLGIRLAWPPRVVASGVRATATVTQQSLDRWTRRTGLPARLVMRPGRLVARVGVAGLRLGQVEMGVSATPAGLRLSPRRLESLGLDLRANGELDVTIPLPALPAGAAVTATEWSDGYGSVSLSVPGIDLSVTRDDLRRARRLAERAPVARGRARTSADRRRPALPPPAGGVLGPALR